MEGFDWCILAADGSVLERFETAQDAYEATYSGDYPEGCEVAFVSNPGEL